MHFDVPILHFDAKRGAHFASVMHFRAPVLQHGTFWTARFASPCVLDSPFCITVQFSAHDFASLCVLRRTILHQGAEWAGIVATGAEFYHRGIKGTRCRGILTAEAQRGEEGRLRNSSPVYAIVKALSIKHVPEQKYSNDPLFCLLSIPRFVFPPDRTSTGSY